MVIVKRIMLSIVIGLIAYEITRLLLNGGVALPVTTPEISLLLLFMATSFASLMAGGGIREAVTGERELGTVKWFNLRKGYGFITRDQGDDIFVHFRNIEGKDKRGINEGQRVSFVVSQSGKGPQAEKVSPE